MSFTVDAQIKDMFFDREKVLARLGRANTRRLSRMGAFVRRRARTDILRRGPKSRQPSSPGSPPRVYSRDAFNTLRNILFGLDSSGTAVLIGPRRLNKKLRNSSAATVPELLEKGGTAQIPLSSNDGINWQLGHRAKYRHHKSVQANYAARPFMGPALAKEVAAGTVANVWSAGVS